MNLAESIINELLRPRLVISKYGFLPLSIWNIKGKPPALNMNIRDELGKDSYSVSFQGKSRMKEKGVKSRLSQFHPEVARRCIMLWSEEGDILYDPFNERIPRVLTANTLKRHAIGTDISRLFQKHNVEKLVKMAKYGTGGKIIAADTERDIKFEGEINGYNIRIYCCDSRNVSFIRDESVDMVFTSPPYFQIEWYGDEDEQLGYGKAIHGETPNYQKFLSELKKVAMENFRVLKPGKFCVWVVADIRIKDEFISFSSDTINLMKDVGFKHHDTVVYNIYSKSVLGIRKAVEKKYTAKSHEYILVFKKPEFTPKDINRTTAYK